MEMWVRRTISIALFATLTATFTILTLDNRSNDCPLPSFLTARLNQGLTNNRNESTHRRAVNSTDNSEIQSTPRNTTKLLAVSNRSSSQSRQFAVAVHISEQMTMAMSHTYQLARMATEWGARAVLPFIQGDHLSGLPTEHTVSLNLLYNLSKFKDLSENYSILPFVNFDTFMKQSDRVNVYFFYIYYFNQGGEGPVIEKCSTERERDEYLQSMNLLNDQANKRQLPEFIITNDHCCRVLASKPVMPEDFIVGCTISMNRSFTILINNWRGYSPTEKKDFRIFAPNYLNRFNVPHYDLPYSKHLLDSTKKFTWSLTNGNDFIGVHIRAQKLLIRHNEDSNFHDTECIIEVLEKVHEISKIYPTIKYIVYIADSFITEYSSILQNITVSRFIPAKFEDVDNGAFTAQVEQNFLSTARVLIMCGGGSFEQSILLRYKTANPNGNIHTVC